MHENETPHLRWFERTEHKCQMCGKAASGILRGVHNESYGPHCERCAKRRLMAPEKVRASSAPLSGMGA